MKKFIFHNSQGKEVVLNEMEQYRANALSRRLRNDLGVDINVTALTTILKSVIDQKFFEVKPSDFMPVVAGEGAWSEELTTYRSFNEQDDFETGIMSSGVQENGRLPMADANVDSVSAKVYSWNKGIGWNLVQLQQALKAGNWSLIEAKERSRKKNWDLGIQKIAFLGLTGDNRARGLLNQFGLVTEDTTTIPTAIFKMSDANFKLFTQQMVAKYRKQNNRTAWPTHFAIPEDDYLGLVGVASTTFPLKSMLEVLSDCFKTATRNPNFKIEPISYADKNYNTLNKNVYALYNNNVDSMRLNIPVDYTSTLANSIDNYTFQNAAYGQFTGLQLYRNAELMYFTNTVDLSA